MSIAQEWAKKVRAVMGERPSIEVEVLNFKGGGSIGVKEIAFVVAYDGVPKIQLKGGLLSAKGAFELAQKLRDLVCDTERWEYVAATAESRVVPPGGDVATSASSA